MRLRSTGMILCFTDRQLSGLSDRGVLFDYWPLSL